MGAVVLNGVGVLVYVGDIVGTGIGGLVQCKVVRRAGFGEGSGVGGGVAIGAGVRMCVVVMGLDIVVGGGVGVVESVGSVEPGRCCMVVRAALICF